MHIPKLIVHGGAWSIPDEMDDDHIRGVHKAVATVYPQLQQGISALDAVEAAVNILEEDPTFDAGRGAFLNAIGEIELDAIIMNGATLDFGAVAGVQNILHPVSLSRKIMEKTEHCMLVGKGAQEFAAQLKIPILDPRELLTKRELAFYEKIKNDPSFTTRKPFDVFPKGTVGAVALDRNGNLAAATSTGGTPRKLPGRVGDTPIVGAGCYAENEVGAASATGWGESIMKVLLSKSVLDLSKQTDINQAAIQAIQLMKNKVDGLGGIIAIDKDGNYGFAYNTLKMAFAFAQKDGEVSAHIRH